MTDQQTTDQQTTEWSANPDAAELLEQAWGIIANAGGGNWDTQTPEWREAAASFLNRWTAWPGRLAAR